jgi:hypothetical protein
MTQPTKTTDGTLLEVYRGIPIVWLSNGRLQWDIMGGKTYYTAGEARTSIDNWLKARDAE